MKSLFPMPETLDEGRALLALDVPPIRRKQLGQCFTGLRTGRLLAAMAVRDGQKRIIDPMAGHGDLLEAAAERMSRFRFEGDELRGVEIEPEAAALGQWRVERCVCEFGFARGRFAVGDAFDAGTWETSNAFDLVITNPPYVRYQTLTNGGQDCGVKLMNADATRLALERLADKLSPPEERLIWRRLIQSYSGLADLSVPSWLLCGLLTAPSGVLALVVPQTWLNRDYARLARYFFLRFFHPIAVVHESGQRWFRDALVPVSLVVGRRLPSDEVMVPLLSRRDNTEAIPDAEISPSAATATSHVGKAFAGDDPEGQFAVWLVHGHGSRIGVVRKQVAWTSQRDEVLAAARGTDWLRHLEGELVTTIRPASSSFMLPPSVAQRLPVELLAHLRPLSAGPIRIGQGLRTGCNAFFYLEVAGDESVGGSVPVRTGALLGGGLIELPADALKPVLRRQSELSGIQVVAGALRGRLLDLRNWLLPENAPKGSRSHRSQWRVMPESLAAYVRRAARTHLVRGESRVLIPALSAVKPNGFSPDEDAKSPSLLKVEAVRMWYMVPDFAPRHLPALCVPRIIHDAPTAFLNCEPPVLVDANFSTLWCEGSDWTPQAMLAVLDSAWGEMCMEALGATLGGGALKLEATHLRQLPVPIFSWAQKAALHDLVTEALQSGGSTSEMLRHRMKVDQVVMSALAGRRVSLSGTKILTEKITAVADSLRAKRRRNYQPLKENEK